MPSSGRTPQETVRDLLLKALSDPKALTTMESANLDLTLRVARRARLLGRLAVIQQDADSLELLPGTTQDQLHSALVLAESRARLALWELDRLGEALADSAATIVIAMKGCAYLVLGLRSARGRIFADVDLMLPESELTAVETHLNQRGWRSGELTPYDQNYYRKWTHELPPLVHAEREVEVDLHHNVLPRTARLKPHAGRLLAGARPVDGSRFHVLSDEDIVLHAITHLMFNDDLADKLRDLVDIVELLRHFSSQDDQFWARLLARAEILDLRRATFYGLRYAHQLLDFAIPDSIINATDSWGPPAPIVWLMDRLVPRALFPPHPDHVSRLTDVSRLLLYIRSHWIRMPPWLLIYHLSYKFWVRRLGKH